MQISTVNLDCTHPDHCTALVSNFTEICVRFFRKEEIVYWNIGVQVVISGEIPRAFFLTTANGNGD